MNDKPRDGRLVAISVPYAILGVLALAAAALLLFSTTVVHDDMLRAAALGAFFTCIVAALAQFGVTKVMVWPNPISLKAPEEDRA